MPHDVPPKRSARAFGLLVALAATLATAAFLQVLRSLGALPDTSWMSTAILVVAIVVGGFVGAFADDVRSARAEPDRRED